MDHADLLSPGTAQSLLVLAALLDGNGIPGTIFTTAAARRYCRGVHGGSGGQPVEDGLAALERRAWSPPTRHGAADVADELAGPGGGPGGDAGRDAQGRGRRGG